VVSLKLDLVDNHEREDLNPKVWMEEGSWPMPVTLVSRLFARVLSNFCEIWIWDDKISYQLTNNMIKSMKFQPQDWITKYWEKQNRKLPVWVTKAVVNIEWTAYSWRFSIYDVRKMYSLDSIHCFSKILHLGSRFVCNCEGKCKYLVGEGNRWAPRV